MKYSTMLLIQLYKKIITKEGEYTKINLVYKEIWISH